MEALRFIRGNSAPPIATIGLDHRHHHHPPAARVGAVAPRAGPPGGAIESEAPASAAAGNGTWGEENWVMKILRVGSLWKEGRKEHMPVSEKEEERIVEDGDRCIGCDGGEGCCSVEEAEAEEKATEFDRESFSRLLRRVSLSEAELYSKMSYLGNLAYSIPKIKPDSLLKYHGLRLVTSSLEKKAILSNAVELTLDEDKNTTNPSTNIEENDVQGENGVGISASVAYQIAASAAAYLQSQTMSILPLRTDKAETGDESSRATCSNDDEAVVTSSEVASFVATTNSVTAVVAGKDEMKDAVAEDLNSAQSSPCEWFICDEEKSRTRYFVIQGSESVASWQANLLFEPIQFEGLDVLVHRGIYEVAKGIYQQMLPEVQAHLKYHGESATFRFTGHSLGGSLALLMNLMLLIRGDAPPSSLLPVITFGSPSIMCGGNSLLRRLGLPQRHVQAITMHRDVVPRAFSCHYPDHIAKILKAVNRNFRNHPCLKNQSILYAPMGKLLILQPEEKFSPHHHLLPPGSGLYLMGYSLEDTEASMKLLRAAQSAFLNSPHPLETLSDRSAYGSDGTIFRDHDMNAYLRSVQGVFRQELKLIRNAKREHRQLMWWPLVSAGGMQSGFIVGRSAQPANPNRHHFSFTGVLHGGRETLERLVGIVASQHVRIFIVLLVPARMLFLGTLSLVNFS